MDCDLREQSSYQRNRIKTVEGTGRKNTVATTISQISRYTNGTRGFMLHDIPVRIVNLVAHVIEILKLDENCIHLMLDDYTSGGPIDVQFILELADSIAIRSIRNSYRDLGSHEKLEDHIPKKRHAGDDTQVVRVEDSKVEEDLETRAFSSCVDAKSYNSCNELAKLMGLKIGDYVRCLGSSKRIDDKVVFFCYRLSMIEDPNEVTAHTLEVIRDSLKLEKLSREKKRQQQEQDLKRVSNCSDGVINSYQRLRTASYDRYDTDESLSHNERKVLDILRQRGSSAGNNMEHLLEIFKGDLSQEEVLIILNKLTNEGLCWCGEQENSWATNE